MFCPECGSKNEDDSTFCTNCGANIGGGPYSRPSLPDPKSIKSYRNEGITIAVIIILLGTGLFGFVYLFMPDGDTFVADEYVLYGDGAVGSGIISVVADPSDVDPFDDISIVTLTFEKYKSGNYDWGLKSLDQPLRYVDEDYGLAPSDNYYYYERKYEVPGGATFSEDERSMTCALSPGYYSVIVIVNFQKYTGSFAVGGEVTRNYEWTYITAKDSFRYDVTYPHYSFELDFKFQYSDCISGIEYDGRRGYIEPSLYESVFKTYVYDGNAVTKDLESELRELYDEKIPLPYRDDDYYYASFILTFVQQVISYYPVDLIGEAVSGDLMSADEIIYGSDEYWAFPTETILHGAGDCEDTSFLCAALFKAAGFDAAVAILPGHVMAGLYLENGIRSSNYPHYDTYHSQYVISEDIYDNITSTTKTYYGCETTADFQYLLGYTNLTVEIKENGVTSEDGLNEWVPPGKHATDPKTDGFYPV